MNFNAGKFWEKRLKESFDLQGVGYSTLGLPFNAWMYTVRAAVFKREISKYRIGPKVLDVGSGTGFYINFWKDLEYTPHGMDISSGAVEKLQKTFPQSHFVCANIGSPNLRPEISYDAVSAFDVLFHIVDDAEYEQSLKNISAYLKPGGYFFYAENLPESRVSHKHQVSRSRREVTALLRKNSFEIVSEAPMFCLMNQPVASKNKILKMYWIFLEKILRRFPSLGNLVGFLLYCVEIQILCFIKRGPSTKLLVCRKFEQQLP